MPPVCPLFLPAAESVPETLTVCVGCAGRLARGRRGAEHNHAVLRADRVGFDDAGVVDDRIDHLARRHGGQLNTAAIGLSLPSFLTSVSSGCPVATSLTVAAIESLTPSVISLSP